MLSRKSKYSEESENSNIDNLSKKLAVDLRKHIRKLQLHPVLSQEWFIMVETLQHITNVAVMEQQLPKKDGGTLWDRDELTVRFVLEEGKLNLCLRSLIEFKDFARHKADAEEKTKRICQSFNLERSLVDSNINAFEQSMGLLLKCCFKSVETIQTCDLPSLIQHCSKVLKSCLCSDATIMPSTGAGEKSQEVLCFSYLHMLATYMEHVGEDQVLIHLQENDTVATVVDVLHTRAGLLPKETQDEACEFLSLIFESERFSTYRDSYIGSSTTQGQLVGLRDSILDGKLDEYQQRKKIQGLIDVINRLDRQGVAPMAPAKVEIGTDDDRS